MYSLKDFAEREWSMYFSKTYLPYVYKGKLQYGKLMRFTAGGRAMFTGPDGTGVRLVPFDTIQWDGLNKTGCCVSDEALYFLGPVGVRTVKKTPTPENIGGTMFKRRLRPTLVGPGTGGGMVRTSTLLSYLSSQDEQLERDEVKELVVYSESPIRLSQRVGIFYEAMEVEDWVCVKDGFVASTTGNIDEYLDLAEEYDGY